MAITHKFNKELADLYAKDGSKANPQTKFNYAWGLVRSNLHADQQLGVQMLHEIYRENPGRRRECIYYLVLGEYKLGNYTKAKRYNETLLNMEPNNKQAVSMKALINERIERDGLIGMAIAGGVVAVAGAIIAGIFGSSRRRSS